MKIAVCIKQVPDTEVRLRVNEAGTWIVEGDLPFAINESDECALEEALRIAEAQGGEVTVFSLGPDRIGESLRKALALGAVRAVHLNDPALLGGDAAATARTLAAALAGETWDLILTGSQSDDLGFGVTASLMAAELNLPHAWLVMGIDVDLGNRKARVVREMESGMNEIFNLPLPSVLEVQAGINQPRYASLKGIMQAKRKPIDRMSAADLGLAADRVGLQGSGIEILAVNFPEAGQGAQILEGDPATAVASLIQKLKKEARVLA